MALKIISAGAGSGKTYRLTQELVKLLGEGMPAAGIIATTFTRKAAAELQERVRVTLLQEGMAAQADDLSNALIGTVHSLGVKLLRRFAFEAGVSPEVSIIAQEDEHFMFNQALATVLTQRRVEVMDDLSGKLGYSKKDFFDWRKEVHKITDLARSNDFSVAVLEKSKTTSFESFTQFLGKKGDKSAGWFNQQLETLLTETIGILEANEDSTKVTATAVSTLKGFARELKLRGFIYWHQWAKISKIGVGAKSREDVEALCSFAKSHDTHPGFHKDIKTYTDSLFSIAIAAIEEYRKYKKSRGLIDYTDMEASVNQLLDNEYVKSVLKEEISLLMVDEFQDTSPIQLSVFLKLSQLADHSIWVGDPKQSIYGFRGAEPRLMEAIIQKTGGVKPEDIQRFSWRSREAAVFAANAIFTKAFEQMPAEQVALIPKRTKKGNKKSINKTDEPTEMSNALKHWHFKFEGEGRQPAKPWMENCIAQQLADELEQGIYILPKGEKKPRKAKPGDVAILCRSNAGCQLMAEALTSAGLKVAISRSGLLYTAEIKLILACLKYLLNPRDSLSVAEILLLAGGMPVEEIIENRLDWLQEKLEESNYKNWAAQEDYITRLDELRGETAELSGAEMLDLILDELDLRRIITTWGNAGQRLDNVEVLRKYALDYENACNRLHTAASLGGFYLWLDDLERNEKDLQGAGLGEEAVNVLTYHKSKGLEWPIVICHNLDDKLRADVWGLEIIPETEEVDLEQVLFNRHLRYWVNPYSDQYRKTELEKRINESEAKAKKLQQVLQEEARLLYVAITRARDYIIFPSNAYPTRWLNRVWHNGNEAYPVLDPDSNESPWKWNGEFLDIETETITMPRIFEKQPKASIHQAVFIEKSAGKEVFLPYKVDVKDLSITLDKGNSLQVQQYANPFVLEDESRKNDLFKAMSAFFAGDKVAYSNEERYQMAEGLLNNFEVEDIFDLENLLERGTAFQHFLTDTLGAKTQYNNYPIRHFHNKQLFEKTLDFLLETDNGLVLILNNNSSGEESLLKKKAKLMLPELQLCKAALKEVTQNPKIQTWVHFILDGTLIKC